MKKLTAAALIAAAFCTAPALLWGEISLQGGAAATLSHDIYNADLKNIDQGNLLRQETFSGFFLETGMAWGFIYGGIDFFTRGKQTITTSLADESSSVTDYSSTDAFGGLMALYPLLQGETWGFSPGAGAEFSLPLSRKTGDSNAMETETEQYDVYILGGGRLTRSLTGRYNPETGSRDPSPWALFLLFQGGGNLYPHPSKEQGVDRKGYEIVVRLSAGISYRYLSF